MNSDLAIVVLLGLVVLRWVLLGLGAALILRPVVDCPACMGETQPLHRPRLRRLAPWLEWRWCMGCGWSGPSRRLTAPTGSPGHRPRRPAS